MQINYLQSIQRHKGLVIVLSTTIFLLGAIITLLTPRQYSSTVGLLVIQKQSLSMDPYLADRSVERFSETLAQVIRTASFHEDVMNSGYPIINDFSEDEGERRNEWKSKIATEVVPKSGLLNITIYDKNPEQAELIVQAISAILTSEQGANYHGAGDSVQIKTVDFPLTSTSPTKPNIIMNLLTALIVGLFGSIFASIILDEFTSGKSKQPKEKNEIIKKDLETNKQALSQQFTNKKPKPQAPILRVKPEHNDHVKTPTEFQNQQGETQKFIPQQQKEVITIYDHVHDLQKANEKLAYGNQTMVQ